MSGEPDLRALFSQEAVTLLARLSEGALELERGEDPEQVAAMFRAAHTIKGSAGLVGLPDVASIAHDLEDLLARVRSGEQAVDAAVVDTVLEAVDALRATIARELFAAPAPTPAPTPTTPAAPVAPPAPGEADAIAVPLARLDRLVRLAGEGVTARLRVEEAIGPGAADPDTAAALADLERTLADLQRQTLATRMVTLAQVTEPLRRAAREIARATGKEAELVLEGERVELDRGVLDALREPLLHLVRNAVDHGLESPADRRAAGKPPGGTVRVAARRRGSDLVVEISDDGRGLDPARLRAVLPGAQGLSDADVLGRLFDAGISTAERVTDVSGRGVGLDAVRTAVARIRGSVGVEGTPGAGTTFTLTVPVTLAVQRCLLVRTGAERYAIPSHAVAAVAEAHEDALVGLEGGRAIWVGGEIVPVADLATAVGAADRGTGDHAVVLAGAGRRLAVRVDELLGQRELTVQELGRALGRVELVAGASIDVDGSVLLVLDPVALTLRSASALQPAGAPATPSVPVEPGPTVLVVDDALTVRELQRSILERAGYRVVVAEDGEAALAALGRGRPDLVLTDIEMPRLDGFGLVRAIRSRPELASMPVVIISSRADDADRRRGLEAGADGYIVKQAFDEATLLGAVERVLGEGRPT